MSGAESMPSSGLMQLSNGSGNNSNGVVVISNNNNNRMDGTLSQSMDSVNTVAAEEEVYLKYIFLTCHRLVFVLLLATKSLGRVADLRHNPLIF